MHYLHLLFISLLLTGCITEVKPWEKDNLAKTTMSEGGTNPLLNKYEEHVYYSKESSKGGSGVAGGGCGCN